MTRVVWKEEADGFGPVGVYGEGEEPFRSRPFDPGREPPRWVSRSEAEAIAAEHGVELETEQIGQPLSADALAEINARLAEDPERSYFRSLRQTYEARVRRARSERGDELSDDALRLAAEAEMAAAGIEWK